MQDGNTETLTRKPFDQSQVTGKWNSQELNLGLLTPSSKLLKLFCSKTPLNPHVSKLDSKILCPDQNNGRNSQYLLHLVLPATIPQALFSAHSMC